MDAFTLNAQRFAAGRQDMRLRCFADDPFSQFRRRIDHVLAVVENEEDLPAAQECHKAAVRIVSLDHEAERRGDCGWNELGIRQRAQIDKGNGTTETAQQCVRHRNGHGGLAYAAWTDDAHETVRDELLRYGSNSFISTDHPRQWRRQFLGCSPSGDAPATVSRPVERDTG